jgi:hypothetical protein
MVVLMPKNPNRNGSKDKGTRGETGLVRRLQALGMPEARRVLPEQGNDLGDVHTDRVAWQVKAGKAAQGASEEQIQRWMINTLGQATHAQANYGILVTARVGFSPERADSWWAWLPVADLIKLSIDGGYHLGMPPSVLDYPVRLPVSEMVKLLKARGYSAQPATFNLSQFGA